MCATQQSGQLAKIRKDLRPHEARCLMGKNTLMRKVITKFLEENPEHNIANISEWLVGNCGLVFVKKDLDQVREIISANVKPAPAKAGALAPLDVVVPPGPTGCDPGQTSFFQTLNVPTKIVKGQIEIVSALKLISAGEKVGASEAGLLAKLNINPFTYGVKFLQVYMNGSVFDAAVLDISDDDIRKKFIGGLRFLASFSLGVGIPTAASLPHSLGKVVRQMLAISAITNYSFKYSEPWDKLFNLSPEELAKLAAAGGGGSTGGDAGGGEAAGEEAPAKKEKEEAADALDAPLFGDSGAY